MFNKIKCRMFGHKWLYWKDEVKCGRCGHVLAGLRKPIDFSKNTVVPIGVLQVAEAACREAGYNKTAKLLRRCLTAER